MIFKSERASQNSDQILENLKLISQSIPFYEKVISSEPDTQSEFVSELPNYKQKQYWNETVKIERIGKSSALKITSISQDSYTAQILNSQTIKTLIGIAGVYFDIEKDIDIRIINPSMTEYGFLGSYFYLIIKSLIIGFILVFSLFSFLDLILNIKPKKSAKPVWLYKKELPIYDKKKEPFFKKITVDPTKKAAAPENLPIFDGSNGQDLKLEERAPLTHEATSEEVKERLNKLLRGEF